MSTFLRDLRALVDERTPAALEEHLAPFASLGTALEEFAAPARALVPGGKRLRAQLCGAGWIAASGPPEADHPALVHAGAALELFQACALVHDDVIDRAPTRRGLPAAHEAYARMHTDSSRRGDERHFGLSAAILLGDALLACASSELGLALAHARPPAALRAREVFDHMCTEVAIGQYLDVRAEHLPWGGTSRSGRPVPSGDEPPVPDTDAPDDLATVLRVVTHKSARYSVEHPLALGAALAGASRADEDALREVGLPLGEAFQLRDDELGVFGEPATTGKPAGDDLREGKRTALLALTLQALDVEDPAAAQRVREAVGDPELSGDRIHEIRDLMRSSGALTAHEDLVARRTRAGLDALDALDLPARAQAILADLAGRLTTRTA